MYRFDRLKRRETFFEGQGNLEPARILIIKTTTNTSVEGLRLGDMVALRVLDNQIHGEGFQPASTRSSLPIWSLETPSS